MPNNIPPERPPLSPEEYTKNFINARNIQPHLTHEQTSTTNSEENNSALLTATETIQALPAKISQITKQYHLRDPEHLTWFKEHLITSIENSEWLEDCLSNLPRPIEELTIFLLSKFSPELLYHSLRVAALTNDLAKQYTVPPQRFKKLPKTDQILLEPNPTKNETYILTEKAIFNLTAAALLHDTGKEFIKQETLQKASGEHISPSIIINIHKQISTSALKAIASDDCTKLIELSKLLQENLQESTRKTSKPEIKSILNQAFQALETELRKKSTGQGSVPSLTDVTPSELANFGTSPDIAPEIKAACNIIRSQMTSFISMIIEKPCQRRTESDLKTLKYLCEEYGLSENQIAFLRIPPGKLTSKEYQEIQRHPLTGAIVISKLFSEVNSAPQNELKQLFTDVAFLHHQTGGFKPYPLVETPETNQIPISASIVTLADVFAALTEKRVYKEAKSIVEAIKIIYRDQTKHSIGSDKRPVFDESVFTAFIKLITSGPKDLPDSPFFIQDVLQFKQSLFPMERNQTPHTLHKTKFTVPPKRPRLGAQKPQPRTSIQTQKFIKK